MGSDTFKDMAAVLAMLNNMDQRMTKMDQSKHVIHVGCEKSNGPHFTKDFHLDDNRNSKAQVFFSSGDRYDDDWRKPEKEWLPYDEYKKEKRRDI